MNDTEVKDKSAEINHTKKSKKINLNIKKVFNKKILLGLIVLILLSPVVYGFIHGAIRSVQTRQSPQGELLFYVMDEKDIKDTNIKEWLEKNYKNKGVYVYKGNKASDEKYILLATGEQPIQGINIIMESVVGYKDKILVNGRAVPPKSDIVKKSAYPYEVIRVETKNDPREVVLGTMNLYDVFRGIQKPIRISLDNAIVKEINGDTVKLATFRKKDNQLLYTLSENALKQMNELGIVAGDLVSVNLNTDLSKGYPKIENIRKTTRVIEKIKISRISEETKTITVEVNKIPFTFGYRGELENKITKVTENNVYLVKLEKVGDMIYITDLWGKQT